MSLRKPEASPPPFGRAWENPAPVSRPYGPRGFRTRGRTSKLTADYPPGAKQSCTESLRACTALARPAGFAELAGSHAHVAFESLGQVTLVREASHQSNLDNSFIGAGE